MALKLLDETKAEMKAAVGKLVQTLYKLTGNAFIESIPASKIEQIRNLLNS